MENERDLVREIHDMVHTAQGELAKAQMDLLDARYGTDIDWFSIRSRILLVLNASEKMIHMLREN